FCSMPGSYKRSITTKKEEAKVYSRKGFITPSVPFAERWFIRMKLSTKGRYGLRAMIDLARYSEKEPVSLSSIAERQYLSEGYLEQLVAMLKKAGLVAGIRGAQGGYVLAKDPSDISVGDIL